MTKSTFDDGVLSHPKMVEAGEDATDLWMRSIIYCNKYGLGGVIRTGAVRGFTSKPQRVVDQLIERLVSARLWEVEPGVGWRIHDFHDWNWTEEQRAARREEIGRKRSEAGRKGNEARWGGRSQSIANGSQTDRNDESQVGVANSQDDRPPPSPSPSPSPEENPPTPASGGGVAPRAKAPKPRRAAEPSLPIGGESPLPFTVGAGMDAMEAASDGCFTAAFDKRWAKQLTDAVRAHPAIEEWTRVGQWLAAGGLKFRNDLSAKWLATTPEVFAIARAWEERGAPNLGRSPAQSGSFLAPAADDERAAFNAEIERQRAALRTVPMLPEVLRRIEGAR